jgi:hypothetical protein
MRRALTTASGVMAVMLVTPATAYAQSEDAPPSDNGKWVGLIAFLVFIAVVGGMLFIANAYRRNNDNR